VSGGNKKAKKQSKGKSSVKGEAGTSRKTRRKWPFKAGDNIPGILDEAESSYKPTGIHKEFLDFAKIFRGAEKKLIP
jgi:hypothetical protein